MKLRKIRILSSGPKKIFHCIKKKAVRCRTALKDGLLFPLNCPWRFAGQIIEDHINTGNAK